MLVRGLTARTNCRTTILRQGCEREEDKVQRLREEPEAAVPRVPPRQTAEYRPLVRAPRKVRGQHARAPPPRQAARLGRLFASMMLI